MLTVLVAGISSLVAIIFVKVWSSKGITHNRTGYECGFRSNLCDILPPKGISCLVILELIVLFLLTVIIGLS